MSESIDLVALRDSDERDTKTGRFQKGNMAALKHGQRSMSLAHRPEIARAHKDRTAQIAADLGGNLTCAQAALVTELARLQIMTDSLGFDVLRRGAMTGKGSTRAAVNVYLQVLDRQQRLAQLLGLGRKPRTLTNEEQQEVSEWKEAGSLLREVNRSSRVRSESPSEE